MSRLTAENKSRNARHVKLVAMDASEALIEDLRAGWIDALVVQNPFRMGYEATRAVGIYLQDQQPPQHLDSGATLMQAADLDRPEIRGPPLPRHPPLGGVPKELTPGGETRQSSGFDE